MSRLSSTVNASVNARERPGGYAPSTHPIRATMLGSLIVIHLRHRSANAGSTRATCAANRLG